MRCANSTAIADIVHVTGTSGYTAAQQALGALLFGDVYTGAPRAVAKDPERCVPTTGRPVIADVRRHLECAPRRARRDASHVHAACVLLAHIVAHIVCHCVGVPRGVVLCAAAPSSARPAMLRAHRPTTLPASAIRGSLRKPAIFWTPLSDLRRRA